MLVNMPEGDLPSHIVFNSPRLAEAKENEKLFKSKAHEVFGKQNESYFKSISPSQRVDLGYLGFNIFFLLSVVQTDFLTRAKVSFKDKKREEWFNEWRKEKKFDIKFKEGYLSGTYFGDTIFKIVVIDKEIDFFPFSPLSWFPKYNKNNVYDPNAEHTFVSYKTVTVSGKEEELLLLETYQKEAIVYECLMKSDKGYSGASLKQYWGDELAGIENLDEAATTYTDTTNIKRNLAVHVPNFSVPHEFFGMPDYTSQLKAIVYAFDGNLNRIESVLRENADPKLIVPDTVVDQAIAELEHAKTTGQDLYPDWGFRDADDFTRQASTTNDLMREKIRAIIRDKTKVLGLPADGSQIKPEYISFDGSLESSFKQVTNLKEMIFQQASLVSLLFNPEIATGNLSGEAIKRLLRPTLNMIKRKLEYYTRGLEHLVAAVMEMKDQLDAGDDNTMEKGDLPTVTFDEYDETFLRETLENIQLRKDMALISDKDALKDILKISDEEAENKLEEIKEEAAAKITPMSFVSPDGQPEQTPEPEENKESQK